MRPKVELFLEFRSPYTYLAMKQLQSMNVDIVLRPIDLMQVMERVGNIPTNLTCEAKGRYAKIDLARWAKKSGVAFNSSDMRVNNADACSRAVLSAETSEEAFTVALALYRAMWSEGKAVKSVEDVLAVLMSSDIDVAGIAARIDSPKVIATYASNTDEAAKRGVFGSPTFFVGDEMFFGNDRLNFVREELACLEEVA